MKRFIYIVVVLLATSFAANAQNIWSIQYSMGFPHNDSKSFTNNTSFTGISVDGKSFISDNIAVGGFMGWNVFSESITGSPLVIDGTEIYGNQYRYLNSVPVMANVSYYPTMKVGSLLKPYVAFGLGTIYQESSIELGTNTYSVDGWMFGLSPEAGINIALNENIDFLASYRYVHGFETNQVDAISYSTLNFGLTFKL